MTLTAIKGQQGEDMAFCACDACGAEKTIPARHGDSNGFRAYRNSKNGKYNVTLHPKPQSSRCCARRMVQHQRSPALPEMHHSADRKQQEVAMQTEIAHRQPTPEQEVDIIVALSSAYDRKAKRYAGVETDRSVAEVIGGGCMPGWSPKSGPRSLGPPETRRPKLFGPRSSPCAIAHRKALTHSPADWTASMRPRTSG